MSDPEAENGAPGEDASEEEQRREAASTVTNDAVAGETVFPGTGDGNNGPTGGSPREAQPSYYEHPEGEDEDLDLDDGDLDDGENGA